jgi:arylsulfatase A-like enzyme
MSRNFIYILAAILLIYFPVQQAVALENPPNVVLIAIETLRADHVGCYGYTRDTTPNIDKLARDGTLFTSATSTSSWTMPSHMSMFTSLYPSSHKATDYEKKLDDRIPTLAGILKQNGYTTAGFVSNPTLEARYGFGNGFDVYDDYTITLDSQLNLFGNNPDKVGALLAVTSPLLTNTAIEWLTKNYKRRFFLFIHYFDPHYDYAPPEPYDRMFDSGYRGTVDGRITSNSQLKPGILRKDLEHIIALHDGEIRFTDEHVGKLLRKVDELRLTNNTLIILVSDHGDEFLEHGGSMHAHTLYEELIHIPFIIKYAHVIPEGKKVDTLVSHIDIMPTVFDILKIRSDVKMEGRSLLPAITYASLGGQFNAPAPVYSELDLNRNLRCIRTRKHKLIYDITTKKEEVYDLEVDPKETTDLNVENRFTEAGRLLHNQLFEWMKLNESSTTAIRHIGNKVELDEMTKTILRGLGYLQ